MRSLYVGIDESGNHSQDDCYVVAGCWYVSDRTEPQNVLAATKDKLLNSLREMTDAQKQKKELKEASMHPEQIEALLGEFQGHIYEDNSIVQNRLPWSMSYPAGFTVHTMESGLFRSAFSDYNGRFSELELMQISAVSSVLNPVFQDGIMELDGIDRIRVFFDATTWTTVGNHIDQFIDDPRFEFATANSQAVPGIQFADLASYSWGRNLRKGDCAGAVSLLHNLRVAR
ncbi:DUF3800 domain-containing protein [Haladaptatus sp. CMAA 1911]|uniref:DUF3800 domain-containing protein n=1 Tax=unclassified Haladaptatus TaxID=2622732 RepID=UPI003754DD91